MGVAETRKEIVHAQPVYIYHYLAKADWVKARNPKDYLKYRNKHADPGLSPANRFTPHAREPRQWLTIVVVHRPPARHMQLSVICI